MQDTVAVAPDLEACGLGAVWVSDRSQPEPKRPEVEPYVVASALATVTEHLRIFLPVDVSTVDGKALASLDAVSGGRVEVVLGATPSLVDDIQLLRTMLDGRRHATFASGPHHLEDAPILPPAVQRPVPIWVETDRTELFPAAAELADGWCVPAPAEPARYEVLVAAMNDTCSRLGRKPHSLRRAVRIGCEYEEPAELSVRWCGRGIDWLIVTPGAARSAKTLACVLSGSCG